MLDLASHLFYFEVFMWGGSAEKWLISAKSRKESAYFQAKSAAPRKESAYLQEESAPPSKNQPSPNKYRPPPLPTNECA